MRATASLVLLLLVGATAARAASPDFDAVTWVPLGCTAGDPAGDENPASTDLVGNSTFPVAYSTHDSTYLYFRYRLDTSPSGTDGFDQFAWVALMQTPSGNPFQYQYLLSLNGKGMNGDSCSGGNKGDTIEIWRNNPATDISFSPIFGDAADTQLYAQKYNYSGACPPVSGGNTINTTPLARFVTAADGSNFNATADSFIEFAFPISVLITKGVITSAADLDDSLFFVASSANSNNYNKDATNCRFLPAAPLGITKSVTPANVPVNQTTGVSYTIVTSNSGTAAAHGVKVTDTALPSYMTGVTVNVSASSGVSWTVVSTNPLEVDVPLLAAGKSITVQITANASPHCADGDSTDTASAQGVNSDLVQAQATVHVTKNAPETCNGIDDDCDGQVDEGGDALCDNSNACDGAETCGGAAGCQAGTPVVCVASDQCHDPGVCAPGTGLCSNPAKTNGASCNDGNACTQTDTCQAGVCVGGNGIVCSASDQCHLAGTCDTATGVCSNPIKSNGSSCSDGNACTDGDTCQSGSCTPGAGTVCVAQDQCHVAGVCNTTTGQCSNPNKSDGSSCSDGDACTQSDTCQGGTCTGANPVVCTAQDQCHDVGVCDPANGTCSNPNKTNGSSCSDGNACTQDDTCQNGSCTGADPVVCSALDQCHDVGTCNTATGVCSNPPKSNGSACSDGNLCTQSDTCQGGSCVGANPVTCSASDDCHQVGTCDPTTGVCSNPTEPDGTACNNPGNLCLQTHQCVAGVCTGSNPVTCPPTDQCHTAGVCNTGTGTCSNPAKADGSTCNDGNACTQTDTCQSGSCEGMNPVVCTAQDQCHVAGVCDPDNGTCTQPTKPNGTACSDGNACTQDDTCQSGACTGSDPVICAALDQCHVAGVCNTQTGVCSNPAKPDGSTCSDGDACTQTDTCQGGSCDGGNPKVCTASNQCHIPGVCDPGTGVCSNPIKTDGTSCSDGNACTQSDTCDAGSCMGAFPVVCTAQDQCHNAGTCNPQSGTCSNPAKPNGTVCSDDNGCTQTDTCQNGGCQGTNPVVCTVQDQCHLLGTCDPDTGMCSNPTKPNDSPCNDGDACSQTDVCESGICFGTNHVVCTASDQCHEAGSCDPNTGTCSNPTAPDGISCNDLNACTFNEACHGGQCNGGTPVICNSNNPCLTDMCNPSSTGGCFTVPNNAGTCSDGDACTTGEHCVGGVCQGGTSTLNCDDNQVCTADQCDNTHSGCFHINLQTPCTDGNACTNGDVCGGGICNPGPPKTCDDQNPCTNDACVAPGGCVFTPDDTNTCSDDNNCTAPDLCVGGVCKSTPVDCDDSNDCTLDSCDDQGGGFLCKNTNCTTVPASNCPAHCFPHCGDGHIDANETCDPPNLNLDPVTGQVICRTDCTSCGDGVVQAGDGEACDDAKAHSTEDGLCNGLKPVDQCLNVCKGVVCKDPALIKFLIPLHLFKFHGQLVSAATVDFPNNHFVIELQDVDHDVLFRSSLLAGSLTVKTPTSFLYKNLAAKAEGGVYKLRLKQARGSYKAYVQTYGDLSLSIPDMVTHVYSGTNEWAVRGLWTPINGGWKLSGKSTFLPVP